MSTLQSFDPTRATVIIDGFNVTGWAPDTKFEITPTNSRKTVTEGVDGDISVNIDSRYSGTLTINLLQNATFNVALMGLSLEGNRSNGGRPFFEVVVTDPTSGYILQTKGWIQEEPAHAVAQETGTKTWTIGLANTRGGVLDALANNFTTF